ncbi:MAG: metallophosphoesterase [Alistipes sp.]|nr:metallophosphoesterase [Alistipes sp.]
MVIAVIFILSLLLIWGDWRIYRRYVHPSRHRWLRHIAIALFATANLLPYVAMAMIWLSERTNIVFEMWLLTFFTLLSLSRIALYAGIFIFKNRVAKWLVGISLCTIVAWVLIVGVVRTRKELSVKCAEIVSTQLPQAFDRYRIVFFSDLHIGSLISAAKVCHEVVDRINALDADLVIFGGDLINVRYDELTPTLANILGKIEAHDGVVAVLGNHDTGVYFRDTVALPIEENTRLISERIEKMGWRVIDDKTQFIVRGEDSLTLTGIGLSRELLEHRHSADVADELDLRHLYKGVPRDKYNITVSHMPQLWRKISALGYGDLVLSGHVHAMQMKGRIGSFSFSPAQLMYNEWSGLYTERNSNLYITDGIGSVGFHLRIGAPPEITELTLRRAD